MKVIIQPEKRKTYKKSAAAKERPVQRDVRQGWAAGGLQGRGPGISPTTYLEKPESRDIILNPPGGLRERDLFGLEVEERVKEMIKGGESSKSQFLY